MLFREPATLGDVADELVIARCCNERDALWLGCCPREPEFEGERESVLLSVKAVHGFDWR